jgi:5-methylcytosine-specific restriction enzyme subunit McrC
VTSSAIPIENIYYLLCYAWDQLEERDLTNISITPETRLPDLFARVLRSGLTQVIKRGLDRSYVSHVEELAGVRGRIQMENSVRHRSFQRGRAWCAFDELSVDALHNRIVKTTLRRLATLPELDRGLSADLRDLYRRLPEISEIRIEPRYFRSITLKRSNAYYAFLLNICELLSQNLLPDEKTGSTRFRDFTRDDRQMARLFERFLFNFYKRELVRARVSAPRLSWHAIGKPDQLAYLPEMQTDIVVDTNGLRLVIDAKYYTKTLSENFGKASITAANLYQLFTYMKHLTVDGSAVGGLLIYPKTTQGVLVDIELFGHPVRAATINLDQPWRSMHADLLRIVAGPHGT